MITEMTNTTFVIWSRPLKCRAGGTTWSAALQRRRFCQAKPSLLMPLLVLLLGKMDLPSSSWVLKISMDRSSADFITLFPSSGFSPLIQLFQLLFLCLERPAGLKITGLKPHRICQNLLGKSNRSPSRWLHKSSSSHSLEGRIVSNLYNI